MAWHLAPAFENYGVSVASVYSRSRKNAKQLVSRLYDARIATSLDFGDSQSDWFIITVPDSAISEVSREIVLPENAALIHTSGNTPIEDLMFAAANAYGVFYPFQTFTAGKQVNLSDSPLLLEATSPELFRSMHKLAKKISKQAIECTTSQRQRIHLAGVFASNFTNHMLTLASEIAEEQGFSREIIYPLVVETINKALQIDPENAQTGPARRGDLNTIDNHLHLLENKPNTSEIYQLISRSIMTKFKD